MTSTTPRRQIAHSELWAWAQETENRHRISLVGISSQDLQEAKSSLNCFIESLTQQSWLSLSCVDVGLKGSAEHQLSAQILELEALFNIPEHIELEPHNQLHKTQSHLKQSRSNANSENMISTLLSRKKGQGNGGQGNGGQGKHPDDLEWDKLNFEFPEVLQPLSNLESQDHQDLKENLETEVVKRVEKKSVKSQSSPEQFIFESLIKLGCHKKIVVSIADLQFTSRDLRFLESLIRLLKTSREQCSLLVLWLAPSIELDDSVLLNIKKRASSLPKKVLELPATDNIKATAHADQEIDSKTTEDHEGLDLNFELGFQETFNAQAEITPVEASISCSLSLEDFTDDPLIQLSSTQGLKESSETVKEMTNSEQIHLNENAHSSKHEVETNEVETNDAEGADHTTTELPILDEEQLKAVQAQHIEKIDRGTFKYCTQELSKRFGHQAMFLMAAAVSGPTTSMGQVVALWRGIVERPLEEHIPFHESLWESLSLALGQSVLIETQHQRFMNEPSFRFRNHEMALFWRQRWTQVFTTRLLRRAYRNLASWMTLQNLNPIAQPQVALSIVEVWLEAGETNQACLSSLEVAKIFLERGDGARAKRALQKTIQLLGPDGHWPTWRECFELLLKLTIEAGDELASEMICKQFIERAWRVGDVTLSRKLSNLLVNLYKKLERTQEAQQLGDWAASQPLVNRSVALFDSPLTIYPHAVSQTEPQSASDLSKRQSEQHQNGLPSSTVAQSQHLHPTLFADPASLEQLSSERLFFEEADQKKPLSQFERTDLMILPDIHTLEAPPSYLLEVLVTLRDQGYEAFVVGGSVRDRLLGRTVNDWDLTTNALPNEVMACFDKVIETGIEHGTVTVVHQQEHVEITTYRVDGDYIDGRRPEAVSFTRSLNEDLVRRDFTINAIAWDPIEATLHDPYQGCRDLQKKCIRAVGDSHLRFQEDGLRVLRAIRFATVLNFNIEPATKLGAIAALDVLKRVAAERIQVELLKILISDYASRGLSLIREYELTDICFPKQALISDQEWKSICEAMKFCKGEFESRMALVFHGIQQALNLSQVDFAQKVKNGLKLLKLPNKQLNKIVQLLSFSSLEPSLERSPVQIRALAVEIGVEHIDELWAYQEAWCMAQFGLESEQVISWRKLKERIEELEIDQLPKSPKDLDLTGHDLCTELNLFPSRAIGELLNSLLWWVWEEPKRNHYDQLIAQARLIASERGMI